jgi:phosphohistidine phosphatase
LLLFQIILEGAIQSTMKLYLLRHGIAVDRIGGEIKSDWERPLTKEGQEETKAVALGLRKIGVRTDLIVSSPLIRAKQTAQIIMEVLAKDSEMQISEALAPGGLVSDLYKFLNSFRQKENIFFVGHEPDIGRLAGTLLWTGPELHMPFKKAGICRIDIVDIPPSSPGVLKWFLNPKILCSLG